MSPSAAAPPQPIRRIVTGHNDRATAIISREDLLLSAPLPHGNIATLLWSSDCLPANANASKDMGKVHTGITNQGSIARIVDFPPHSTGTFHRTISLDYGVVLKGQLWLTLDDGSKTPVDQGDVVVQQATMHGWDNDTDEWARAFFVLIAAGPLVVDGVQLETEMSFSVE